MLRQLTRRQVLNELRGLTAAVILRSAVPKVSLRSTPKKPVKTAGGSQSSPKVPAIHAAIRPNSPYGVAFGATELDPRSIPALNLASEAGIGWLRVTFFWARIEPTQGQVNWSGYDALLAKAQSVGMSVLGTISYVTLWNTTAPSSVTSPALREHYPPANLTLWVQYVEALVKRYGNQVHFWEVWNEPDLQSMWGGTPEQYAQLLAVTYQAIKRVNPNATVVMGGLALGGPPNQFDADFLNQILHSTTYPARNYIQVANFHAYGSGSEIARRLNYIKTTLAQAGLSNLPIWITEIGYPSDRLQQETSGYQDGPPSQAKWLVAAFTQLRQAGVARLFWFQIYDPQPLPQSLLDPYGTYGLMDSGLHPKPALGAYARLIGAGH